MRQSHRNIKVARKKRSVGGTEKLTRGDPNNPNGLAEVIDKVEMEDMLREANEKKFRGSIGTPLTVEPMRSALGPMGTTKKAEQILIGNFSWIKPTTDKHVKKFLSKVLFPQSVRTSPAISAEIRPSDFVATWRRQNERTQSSISGLHFGFFKAILHQPVLTSTRAHMSSFPFEAGCSPDRWRSSLNVHLLKKERVFTLQTTHYTPARSLLLCTHENEFQPTTYEADAMHEPDSGGAVCPKRENMH